MTATILFSTEIFISPRSLAKNQLDGPFLFQLSSTSQNHKLEAKISSRTDPFFLYFWSISSEEYSKLKETQNLVLTFSEFPTKLAELMQTYKNGKNEASERWAEGNSGSRYSIKIQSEGVVEMGGSFRLSIVEENSFRSFEVVSLVFEPANEALLREHVLSVFAALQRENEKSNEQNAQLSQRVQMLESAERIATTRHASETKAMSEEIAVTKNQLVANSAKIDQLQGQLVKIGQERDFLQVEKNAFLKGKTELEERERAHEDSMELLKDKIAQLSRTIENQRMEIEEGKISNGKLQLELERFRNESAELREENERLGEMHSRLNGKIENLENSVRESAHLQESLERTKRQLERVANEKELMQTEILCQSKGNFLFDFST